ncbi:MAG: alpha/beta hydrolase [Xanthomonadales bacterium]|nr:alpha/beta hydrolase [Xanthomonadales bacterium]
MFKRILLYLIIFYVGFGLFLYIKQDSLLFYPTEELIIADVRVQSFTNQNQIIKAFVLNPGLDDAIIYFAGNAEAVGMLADFYRQIFPNKTVYLMNYRGYGGSTGEPSEQAFFSDALHIYDQLKSQHQKISIIGKSLGSGVATYLASQREIFKLVLITPFDSITSLAQQKFPFFPVSWIVKNKFDSMQYAKQIKTEVLVFIAENDQIVPLEHSNKLLQVLPNKQSHYLKNTNHNSLTNSAEYSQLLVQFFQQ